MFYHEVVFDAIIEQFQDDMFGPYSNSVESGSFKRFLVHNGWKYFDRQNLNELFQLKYYEKVEAKEIEQVESDQDTVIQET